YNYPLKIDPGITGDNSVRHSREAFAAVFQIFFYPFFCFRIGARNDSVEVGRRRPPYFKRYIRFYILLVPIFSKILFSIKQPIIRDAQALKYFFKRKGYVHVCETKIISPNE